jgi:5-methylcytosine-specific restriction enzyme subunit McrC
MIRRSVREWEDLQIGDGPEAVSRMAASRLIAIARKAQKTLRVGGSEGEAVLIDRGHALRAAQVVGVLTAPGISLEILPKIDGLDDGATRLNLVRMLACTIGLNIAEGALAELGHQHFDLLEMLIRVFCDKLFAAVHRGLPRRYLGHEDDLSALRGRLDIKRQFTMLAASPQRLACHYEELSVDNPLNQILKAAVRRLRSVSRATENQRRLVELEFAFADAAMVPLVALPWESVVLDRTNTEWHDLLRLAGLLLGNRFQTTSMGENLGFSLLFEMNVLFEEFVGRVLQRALRTTGLIVTLQKPCRFALSELRSGTPRFMTKPDIVVHDRAKPKIIIDTKWKRLKASIEDRKLGVSQADVYQMIAYGQVYDVHRLLLLYPHHRELGATGIQSTHLIVGTSHSHLSVATVDLSRFEAVAEQLAVLCGGNLEVEAA